MTQFIRSILDGAKTIINLFPGDDPELLKPIRPPHLSDAEALRSDWEAVGRDLWKAMGKVDHETSQTRR